MSLLWQCQLPTACGFSTSITRLLVAALQRRNDDTFSSVASAFPDRLIRQRPPRRRCHSGLAVCRVRIVRNCTLHLPGGCVERPFLVGLWSFPARSHVPCPKMLSSPDERCFRKCYVASAICHRVNSPCLRVQRDTLRCFLGVSSAGIGWKRIARRPTYFVLSRSSQRGTRWQYWSYSATNFALSPGSSMDITSSLTEVRYWRLL
jgi:hypothetical protein